MLLIKSLRELSWRRLSRDGRAVVVRSTPVMLAMMALLALSSSPASAQSAPRHFPLALQSGDVIATGNEWLALPAIRASDGAIMSFNVLSMQHRGLLEVDGAGGSPVLQPYVQIDGAQIALKDLQWELLDYWIPVAHLRAQGVDLTFTYCAPHGSRAAWLRLQATNHSDRAVAVMLGVRASWGALQRVTYTPVELQGTRAIAPAPWADESEVFNFVTSDTQFAWVLSHPHSVGQSSIPPASRAPQYEAEHSASVAPGASDAADFILGAGVEDFSASHNAKTLRRLIDAQGAEVVIAQAASWCRARTRSTGQADLDLLMNRNLLFTMFYAWGRTLDTEQLVGVTSRSPRYYVSAAYWDRDAMLWSFPGLLAIDLPFAREALNYALTIQLRNTGIHSRFIDGIVLEDGFQLDEAVAPMLALASYVERSGDEAFLQEHRQAVQQVGALLASRLDAASGLYSSVQDSQDENRRQIYMTYDNVLTWKALQDMASLYRRLHDASSAKAMTRAATALHAAIWQHLVSDQAPGADGTIFMFGTDGQQPLFEDVPPGSLLKLPLLGFVAQDDPVFSRTYNWLHSSHYKYSYADKAYGLPGSYRLPFTTSWSVADHLGLKRGREQALKVLRSSRWDAGIISEGIDPATTLMDGAGGAFATAAGYVAAAICNQYCQSAR